MKNGIIGKLLPSGQPGQASFRQAGYSPTGLEPEVNRNRLS